MNILAPESSIHNLTNTEEFLTNLSNSNVDNIDTLKGAQIIAIITKLIPNTINRSLPFASHQPYFQVLSR